MRTTWIQVATQNEGLLKMGYNNDAKAYRANLTSSSAPTVWGDYKPTIEEALTSLNDALQEDAAELNPFIAGHNEAVEDAMTPRPESETGQEKPF